MSIIDDNPSIIIRSISLNYLKDSLICSTNYGLIVYNLAPFKTITNRNFAGGLRMASTYKDTKLFFINGTGLNDEYPINRICIWNEHKQKKIAEISLNSRVVALHVSDSPNFIVSSSRKTYLCEIDTLSILSVFDICSFTLETKVLRDDFILCYISVTSDNGGNIMIRRKNRFFNISAHQANISKIAISNDGNYITTASTNGTIIKIFNLLNGELITEFRRGNFSKTISYLGFSELNDYLLCGTINGSVHLFDIKKNDPTINTLWGILRRRSNYTININDHIESISLLKDKSTIYIITKTKFYSCTLSNDEIVIDKTSLLIYKRDPFTPSPKRIVNKENVSNKLISSNPINIPINNIKSKASDYLSTNSI